MEKKRFEMDPAQERHPGDIWLARAVNARADTTLRQRGSIRKAASCSILVRSGTSYSLVRHIHDLSLDGVFVEMNSPDILHGGDSVEVILSFDVKGQQADHSISAEVVRVQHEGVALKFGKYSDQTYTDLVNFLYAK